MGCLWFHRCDPFTSQVKVVTPLSSTSIGIGWNRLHCASLLLKQCKFWILCPSVSRILTQTPFSSAGDSRRAWPTATPLQEASLKGCELQKQMYCWKRLSKWESLPILLFIFQEPHGHLMRSLVHRKWTPGWIKGCLMRDLSVKHCWKVNSFCGGFCFLILSMHIQVLFVFLRRGNFLLLLLLKCFKLSLLCIQRRKILFHVATLFCAALTSSLVQCHTRACRQLQWGFPFISFSAAVNSSLFSSFVGFT